MASFTSKGRHAWFIKKHVLFVYLLVLTLNSSVSNYTLENIKTSSFTGTSFRLWYGQDLRNFEEHDNIGMCCVDVFAKLTPNIVRSLNEVWLPQQRGVCLDSERFVSIRCY